VTAEWVSFRHTMFSSAKALSTSSLLMPMQHACTSLRLEDTYKLKCISACITLAQITAALSAKTARPHTHMTEFTLTHSLSDVLPCASPAALFSARNAAAAAALAAVRACTPGGPASSASSSSPLPPLRGAHVWKPGLTFLLGLSPS